MIIATCVLDADHDNTADVLTCHMKRIRMKKSENGIGLREKVSNTYVIFRPPATTISFYSTSSSPEKKNPSSNRLGTGGGGGVEKPEGPSALQPTTESTYVILVHDDLVRNR